MCPALPSPSHQQRFARPAFWPSTSAGGSKQRVDARRNFKHAGGIDAAVDAATRRYGTETRR